MLIGQLIQTLIATVIGTITGGCIVIATNWLTNRWEKRKAAQEWYEKTYISEGIEPLITYFVNLDLRFSEFIRERRGQKPILPIDIELEPIPIDALAKIDTLLDDISPMWVIECVLDTIKDGDEIFIPAAGTAINKTIQILKEMRKELLKIISAKVNNKSYQINMPHIQEEFENLSEEYLIITAEFEQLAKKAATIRESFEFAEGLKLQSNEKKFAKFIQRLKNEGKYERFTRFVWSVEFVERLEELETVLSEREYSELVEEFEKINPNVAKIAEDIKKLRPNEEGSPSLHS